MATSFPGSTDEFPTFVDEGTEVEEDLLVPTISPFTAVTQQVPKGPSRNINGAIEGTTVFINGFFEVQGTPEDPDQFNVDYNTGLITFHPDQKGNTIPISYQTAGDLFTAEQINDIQAAVTKLEEGNNTPTTITVDKTLATEHVVFADATGGIITISLPKATENKGKVYIIKKIDVSVNDVVIDADGTETIDGALTNTLSAQFAFVKIISDGTQWFII